MLKKRVALFFLTLAYAILLGHNIIPHHHHDHDDHLTGHHDTGLHHADETDTNGLNQLFAQINHAGDVFSFLTNHNIANTFSKLQLSLVAILPDNFSLDEFLLAPVQDRPPAEHLVYISPHSHPSGLRAPPATFI